MKQCEIRKVLPEASLPEAIRERDAIAARTKRPHSKLRFHEFAASLFRAKVEAGELTSPKSIERWQDTLELHLVKAFGHLQCVDMRFAHLEEWRLDQGKRIKEGVYAASTVNGWMSILRVITGAMTARLELPRDPADGVNNFRDDEDYTFDEPNSLVTEEVRKFLDVMAELYPQFYAMTFLGFLTGLRPSNLRAIRREADLCEEKGILNLTHTNAMGQIVVNRTKNGKPIVIGLPPVAFQVFREHRALIESPPLGSTKKPVQWWNKAMVESPLLFPARHGGFRTRSCLDKPFAVVAKEAGIKHKLTPRGMRRTFQDLARAAKIDNKVTRSVSGHQTEAMQELYSTVWLGEQRRGLGDVATMILRTEP